MLESFELARLNEGYERRAHGRRRQRRATKSKFQVFGETETSLDKV